MTRCGLKMLIVIAAAAVSGATALTNVDLKYAGFVEFHLAARPAACNHPLMTKAAKRRTKRTASPSAVRRTR